MSGNILMQILLSGITYLIFSNEFFSFAGDIKGEKMNGFARTIGTVAVYTWFVLASVLEVSLAFNWCVFFFILGVQVYYGFSFKRAESYALSLFCIVLGLAVNIFFRSLMAIVLDKPLNVFDNSMSDWKVYPISMAFLTVSVVFRILRRKAFPTQLNLMLHDRKSLKFYFSTELFIFSFLCVQLQTYSQCSNETGMKLWGIKSALFSGVVLVVTSIYSLRVASLNYYKKKEYENRDRLLQDKEDVDKLWSLAYTDMLTGCNNRQLLEKRLAEYAGYGGDITLAFVDLNGLKRVNDQYGHIEGDVYLKKVAQTLMELIKGSNTDLFRYGGDEFIMLSNTPGEEALADILKRANEMLQAEAAKYSYSLSYGVVHGDSADYKGLIAKADEIMYRHKKGYYTKEYHN